MSYSFSKFRLFEWHNHIHNASKHNRITPNCNSKPNWLSLTHESCPCPKRKCTRRRNGIWCGNLSGDWLVVVALVLVEVASSSNGLPVGHTRYKPLQSSEFVRWLRADAMRVFWLMVWNPNLTSCLWWQCLTYLVCAFQLTTNLGIGLCPWSSV